ARTTPRSSKEHSSSLGFWPPRPTGRNQNFSPLGEEDTSDLVYPGNSVHIKKSSVSEDANPALELNTIYVSSNVNIETSKKLFSNLIGFLSSLTINIMVSFTSLAEEILVSARQLDEHLASKDLAPSSFDQDTLVGLPKGIEAARDNVINITQTLKQLALGAGGRAMEIAFTWTELLSLHAIYSFRIADVVPLSGSITYSAVASQTCIPESSLRRLLRPAMSSHIFTSPTPDTVAHTATSRLLVISPDLHDGIGLQVDELAPVAAKTVEAVRKFRDSGEPHETAFALQNDMPIFEALGKYPERGRRFGAAMRCYTKGEGYDLRHLIEGYDWASMDRPGAVVVDVGGGHGSVSQALARSTKHIQYVVQDLP
ncbi:MAG: hypothetical protein Q9204_008913, partial [Flavoplaca sp. TL-2023a]